MASSQRLKSICGRSPTLTQDPDIVQMFYWRSHGLLYLPHKCK